MRACAEVFSAPLHFHVAVRNKIRCTDFGSLLVNSAQRASVRSTAATVAVDARALVSLVLVNLISLALILSVGAALLRGT